jgi:hypothetical protein
MKVYSERVKSWNSRMGVKINNTFKFPSQEDRELVTALLCEEVEELEESTSKEDVLDALADVGFLLLGAMSRYGIEYCEFKDYLGKVVKSNESKFCDNESEAILSINKEAERLNISPSDVSYVENNGKFVIYNNKTNKILKGINYQGPENF